MIVKRSVTRSIAQALSAIVLLALLTTGLALMTLSSSLRDAEAINLAGSLRMQSYRLAWDSASAPQQLRQHLLEYEETLNKPALRDLDRPWVPQEVVNRYRHLRTAWPALQQQLQRGEAALYQQQVANYVGEIDRFVMGLQRYSERKMELVAASSLLGVVLIVALALGTIRFSRRQVVRPLNALVTASRYVESGNFAFPPLVVEQNNELRVLAQTFSAMAARLHSHHQALASAVEEKTRDLQEANRTLSLLYESSQMLTARPLNAALFESVMAQVRERENLRALVLESEHVRFSVGESDAALSWHGVTLQQDDEQAGALRWQSDQPRPRQALMQSLGNMLSRAVWIWQTQKQVQQMLLIEERATIARELHDSLAQALSFMRIQFTLLRRTLGPSSAEAQSIIADVDRTLSDAYRQLRELLATFRLTIEQADLVAAMQAMIASLQEQVTAKISFSFQPGLETLDAQQQVHLLQIAREAVLNAIRHADAATISVRYERNAKGEHLLTVTDDGIGIASTEEPQGHYGLTTMSERAARLAGELKIQAQARGTQVALRFPPRPATPLT
ncbi:MAG: nitrate/nitrite two-component system sensor histidine kinase NarQ [Pantoea sp.]|uniref:nitrate/nitrite two-component system sensor histidine kinase NarQ n=3 Tax=Erwiniaceae TaxID=1903409 RepID=UPI00065FFED8|nr:MULTISPECIES: nitrate/nitrite two-component system sensor histidine kinase NarQ [Pantoea]MBS6437416.1 nitrate/nitrite two-component system sensor histidine kinase NarQ [Pantoea sp.]MDU1574517.1 nitrate/nitrite two-component system sensor histidine kinase NarQ [Pantoea sp.]MDU2728193.1 nitrate/nitrite two-component system sensor histidine kinase NarQ [Pantoea sp.]MDU6079081.1 nitrate/nitrite two-component system sensor histidine kinase NarQ [Pantoea sp.]MDU7838220.1 nitrate/nitrite two-compo